MKCPDVSHFMVLVLAVSGFSSSSASDTNCSLLTYDTTSEECQAETKCTTGDVTIAIMSNIHIGGNETFWCTDLLERSVELVTAIQWIFYKLSDTNYIRGVHIGKEFIL